MAVVSDLLKKRYTSMKISFLFDHKRFDWVIGALVVLVRRVWMDGWISITSSSHTLQYQCVPRMHECIFFTGHYHCHHRSLLMPGPKKSSVECGAGWYLSFYLLGRPRVRVGFPGSCHR